MTTLIADCETNGLLDAMTKFHMLQLGDADGDDATIYADLPAKQVRDVWDRGVLKAPIRPLAEGLARLAAADHVVFHNGLGYDWWAIQHFHPGVLDRKRILDTLVMARLAHPDERDHSLRAWGRRLEVLKDDYKGDYQTVDDEFLAYSEKDIVVGRALWNRVKHVRDWGTSCAIEHAVAWNIILQERNGFLLNVAGAETLAADLRGEQADMVKALVAVFPPIERVVHKVNKRNNGPLGWVKGETRIERTWEDFNPNSRQQCAERLMMAGWKPLAFGADGTPTLDESVLSVLPFPEAKTLLALFGTTKRLAQLSDGKEGWLRHVRNAGRVHGRVNPNGAVTGRMSHSRPNMANIDKDPRMRGLWVPRPGWLLVGCDAEGLEARMLAHYLARWDGGAYGRMVLEGNSKDRTDVHSANLKAAIKLGLFPMACWKEKFKPSRDGIKNLLYAMMYGGQDMKLGSMVIDLLNAADQPRPATAKRELGALFRRAVGKAIVGLDELTDAVKDRARSRKFLVGLDGRHIPVRSQHAALNALLQGGGAIAMKVALNIGMDDAEAAGWKHGVDFAQVVNVHDEVQMECRPDIAPAIGELLATAIRKAGEELALRCPLAGKAAIGSSWAETH